MLDSRHRLTHTSTWVLLLALRSLSTSRRISDQVVHELPNTATGRHPCITVSRPEGPLFSIYMQMWPTVRSLPPQLEIGAARAPGTRRRGVGGVISETSRHNRRAHSRPPTRRTSREREGSGEDLRTRKDDSRKGEPVVCLQ